MILQCESAIAASIFCQKLDQDFAQAGIAALEKTGPGRRGGPGQVGMELAVLNLSEWSSCAILAILRGFRRFW